MRITWDKTVYTDKVLKHNLPDITLVQKDAQEWNIISSEEEKGGNVSRPYRNQKNSWGLKSYSDTHRIGALGTISKNAKTWYGKLDLPDIIGSAQLSEILGTAHVLHKLLCH